MKKSKNLKRIGAVMLSLVLAVSTVFTTTAVSEKKVSAQAEIKNKKQLQSYYQMEKNTLIKLKLIIR